MIRTKRDECNAYIGALMGVERVTTCLPNGGYAGHNYLRDWGRLLGVLKIIHTKLVKHAEERLDKIKSLEEEVASLKEQILEMGERDE